MTAFGAVSSAVEAMRSGAVDTPMWTQIDKELGALHARLQTAEVARARSAVRLCAYAFAWQC